MILRDDNFTYKFDSSQCDSCGGKCCTGKSGYIWIAFGEIKSLASFLKMDLDEVLEKYINKIGYRFSIKEKFLEKNNYACIFFDIKKKQCSIYEVRPQQCRTFPFWDYFKTRVDEVKEECPAILD